MDTEQVQSAPYVPFATFLTGLDHLAAISIPNKIEMSTFTSMNPHNKAQMVSALKFFNLIDKDGVPAPILTDLAHKAEQRKELMRTLIEKHYPDIVALDFSKMTPSQLEGAIAGKRYNVTGDTRKKAKTFLLKAAQFAGYTPHTLLTKITRTRRRGAARQGAAGGSRAQADSNGSADTPTPPPQDEPKGSQKTIQLRRGGSLSLALSVNLWELKGEDRAFVFDLIDKIDAYEEGSTSSADDASKVEEGAG